MPDDSENPENIVLCYLRHLDVMVADLRILKDHMTSFLQTVKSETSGLQLANDTTEGRSGRPLA